jgi:hypothetical protein
MSDIPFRRRHVSEVCQRHDIMLAFAAGFERQLRTFAAHAFLTDRIADQHLET